MSGLTPTVFTGTTNVNEGTVNGSLQLGQIVEIDGTTNLSSIITFNGGGFIQYIQYVAQSTVLPNQVQVYGAAPSGLGTGHIGLTFTDSTNTSYTLSIYSSTPSVHTLDIFGPGVDIVTIQYSLN